MLTDAQRIIVREICSIQFESLSDILIQTELGKDDDGERYENILKEFGYGRKDFDKELIDTIAKFKEVHNDPEEIYTLEELDLIVFKHILYNFRHKWEDQYPKALDNLWNKLFIWTMANEFHNKQ